MYKSVNKIIKVMVMGDVLLNTGWGFIAPVFAIFIVQHIDGGDAKVAGFAAAAYWITKSLLQIPLAKKLDKNDGEADDFYSMFFGLLLTGFIPFGYMISSLPWHIYAIQILYAIGMAMVVPAWYAFYGRHVDKGKEAYEWGLDSTLLGFVIGGSGAIGGIVANTIGFNFIFAAGGLFTIASALALLLIREDIVNPHRHSEKPIKKPDITPPF